MNRARPLAMATPVAVTTITATPVSDGTKVVVAGAVLALIGGAVWWSLPKIAPSRRRRENPAYAPLSTGEKVAIGGGILGGAALGVYLATRASAPLSSSAAPAASPSSVTTLQVGHEYRIVATSIEAGDTPLTVASIQAEFDAQVPGAFKVKSVVLSGTTATIVADVVGALPAGFTITDSETTFQDLGPIPSA